MKKLPLDLSKFRKVSSDGKTSTFKHRDGHEIKIAHSKLSGEMRAQLDKLPISNGKVENYAFGTPSAGSSDDSSSDTSDLAAKYPDEVPQYNITNTPAVDDQSVDRAPSSTIDPKTGETIYGLSDAWNFAKSLVGNGKKEEPQKVQTKQPEIQQTQHKPVVNAQPNNSIPTPTIEGAYQGQLNALGQKQKGETGLIESNARTYLAANSHWFPIADAHFVPKKSVIKVREQLIK